MELLLAREGLNKKPKKITIEKLLDSIKPDEQNIFYFDRENSHKDMIEIVNLLESKGYNVYFREIKFGLAEEDYMYEVHII